MTGLNLSGGIIDMLTGGRLTKLIAGLILADAKAIVVYSLELTTIAALTEGPRSEISHCRDRLVQAWPGSSGELARAGLELAGSFVNDVRTALLGLAAVVTAFAALGGVAKVIGHLEGALDEIAVTMLESKCEVTT